jgi:2-(1,2-epoxy-1,2-dihydrophenyl)acetyl-CoA isomerase
LNAPVLLETVDGACILTLNRPDEGNRLGVEMSAALDEAAEQLAVAPPRALLIRAEGRMFCVGGAVNEFGASGDFPGYLRNILPVGHRMIKRLAGLPCPVISALQGPVGGAGIALALCADFVIASPSMVLRAGYPALGLSSDFGASWYLTRLVGPQRAGDILMTNRTVNAELAASWGLVGAVHPSETLDTEARALLTRLAQGPTLALGRMKQLIGAAIEQDLDAILDKEADLMLTSASEPDAREGIAAFLGRRTPNFYGTRP